jgi:hypothetical protein
MYRRLFKDNFGLEDLEKNLFMDIDIQVEIFEHINAVNADHLNWDSQSPKSASSCSKFCKQESSPLNVSLSATPLHLFMSFPSFFLFSFFLYFLVFFLSTLLILSALPSPRL